MCLLLFYTEKAHLSRALSRFSPPRSEKNTFAGDSEKNILTFEPKMGIIIICGRCLDMKPKKENIKYAALVIAALTAMLLFVIKFDRVVAFFRSALSVLTPVFAGACIAFVLNEILKPLERLWDRIVALDIGKRRKKTTQKNTVKAKKSASGRKSSAARAEKSPTKRRSDRFRRPVCLVLGILILIGALTALILIIIPELKKTVSQISGSLSDYVGKINEWESSLRGFLAKHSIELPEFSLNIGKLFEKAGQYLTEQGSVLLEGTLSATTSVVSGVVDTFLAFVFAIYLLAQKEKLLSQAKRLLEALLPQRACAKTFEILSLTCKTFSSFVSGQVVEAIILGVLCFIGMLIFRMPYAAPISVVIAFTALIPMFGALIGTVFGAFLILFESPITAVWFVIYLQILQQIEGNFIYPKVVGKSVGLPGIWVLFAVTVGGGIAGIAGMLVGVPICSVLYTLIRQYVKKREAMSKACDA